MSDSTQAANVTAADDFEANRAKTKKALPALLIVFTLGTLMIQAFNLVFQNIGDSLGMSASASLDQHASRHRTWRRLHAVRHAVRFHLT